MGVELPLCVVVTILECCVTFSGVKLSIRSFVLFNSNVITLSCMLQKDIELYYWSLWPTTVEFSILEPFSMMICHIT